MPRLTPAVVHHASRISRHLPLLLRECRDLASAKNELRWLRDFVTEKQQSLPSLTAPPIPAGAGSAIEQQRRRNETLLDHLVERRAKGEPLQYILGTQPFGKLDILCRPNVLIPRPETETYTAEVAKIWQELQCLDRGQVFGVADFCSGSGCISLLLHSLFRSPRQPHRTASPSRIRGFDISAHALDLAQKNLQHNLRLGSLHPSAAEEVCFEKLDLLALSQQSREGIIDRLHVSDKEYSAGPPFDVVISNPPYISPEDFAAGGRTTKSVRKYEPELALVPPPKLTFEKVNRADQFYAALLRIASAATPKLLVMEVGDVEQAARVRALCRQYLRDAPELNVQESLQPLIEIWRDDGSVVPNEHEFTHKASPTMETDHATSARHHTDVDVDCRAVVVWLDPAWIKFRRTRMQAS